jgi:hypothetical protein
MAADWSLWHRSPRTEGGERANQIAGAKLKINIRAKAFSYIQMRRLSPAGQWPRVAADAFPERKTNFV